MSDLFPIYQLTEEMKIVTDRPKQLKGILNKSWYEHPELGLCLFKAATSPRMLITNVRNDWSEKVVYEISKLLDLPAARYEFALAWHEERQSFIEGSLSINCLPSGFESIAGGDFLTSSIREYETGYPSSYSVENVLTSLVQNEVGCPQNWAGIPGIDRATDLFVGYLALDIELKLSSELARRLTTIESLMSELPPLLLNLLKTCWSLIAIESPVISWLNKLPNPRFYLMFAQLRSSQSSNNQIQILTI
jgi:hypothetical protein